MSRDTSFFYFWIISCLILVLAVFLYPMGAKALADGDEQMRLEATPVVTLNLLDLDVMKFIGAEDEIENEKDEEKPTMVPVDTLLGERTPLATATDLFWFLEEEEQGTPTTTPRVDQTVEILMPAWLFAVRGDEYVRELIRVEGVINYDENDDGSVRVVFDERVRDEVLMETRAEFDAFLVDVLENDVYTSVRAIDFDEDFSNFFVKVDADRFEANYLDALIAGDIYSFCMSILLLEQVDLSDYPVVVHFMDVETHLNLLDLPFPTILIESTEEQDGPAF